MTAGLSPLEKGLWEHAREARWFPGRSRGGLLAGLEFTDWFQPPAGRAPGLRSAILQVAYPGGTTERFHMPLACYLGNAAPSQALAQVTWEGAEVTVLEATGDETGLALLLECLRHEAPGFERMREIPSGLTGRRYTGEQTNTSVFYRDASGQDRLVGKVFRRFEDGTNPDVELHRALAGSGAVADTYGVWSWRGAELGIFLTALPEPRDGYVAACHAARAGQSFAEHAYVLGQRLSVIHRLLADRLPTVTLPGGIVAEEFRRSLDAAIAEVPSLEAHRTAVLDHYAAIEELRVPAQRIHGDCHLGQALLTSDGWRYVDFEGEPLKSLAERRAPDSRWRDVAGMLRSLHYTASEGNSPQGWLAEARTALLEGYGPADDSAVALRAAYETSKAVYEAVYESRMRPNLLHVPLSFLGALA